MSVREAVSRPVVALAGLTGAWLALVLLANPAGAFPLNDDWSYSRAVESLVDHGHLRFTAWTSMPLVAQVAWGALFCLPFGFSFVALRVSTVTLGAVGIIATYFLLRELRAAPRLALVGAGLLALNPFYFSLSLTFMTDVPFAALSALSLALFVRVLRTDNRAALLFGYASATGALLIRQPAVIVPLAFALVYTFVHRLNIRTLALAIFPAAFDLALLFSYPVLLRHTVGEPASYISARALYGGIIHAADADWLHVLSTIGDHLLVEILYLGAFFLPLLIVTTDWSQFRHLGRLKSGAARVEIVVAVVFGAIVLARGRLIPMSGNLLFDFGLGPPLLRDTYVLHLRHLTKAPQQFWLVVTVAAVVGGVGLISRIAKLVWRFIGAGEAARTEPGIVLVLIVSVTYLLGTAVATASPEFSFFDRYLTFAIAPLAGVLVYERRLIVMAQHRIAATVTAIVVVLYGAFAVAGTHDYLAWNRARWRALHDLAHQKVPYKKIDGGFEVNGWYRYDPNRPNQSLRSLWVKGEKYMIAFGQVPGYFGVRSYTYDRWMPPGRGRILVLRRRGP